MSKIPIYFIPGLAANNKIFDFLSLPRDKFDIHFIDWKVPVSLNETIEEYAKRMCAEVTDDNPVLVGVSFGGVMVQEIRKIINVKKLIIISSIKSKHELPKRLKFAQFIQAHKLFPTKIIENLEDYTKYFFGDFLQKRAEIYKTYLSVRNPVYLQWSIYNVLNWKQSETTKDIIHIHGTDDGVFPIKHIKNCIKVDKGTHIMILKKAKTISRIIEKECFL